MTTNQSRVERNRLIEAELASLQRYSRALAGERELANDLVQEAIVKALRNWAQWRGDGPLRAWLMTIMRNHFLGEMRARGRWNKIMLDDPEKDTAVPAPQTDQLYLRQLDAALEQLPREQRETLVLVAVEGLSYAETAVITGVKIGTVMSRLSRARAQLRALSAPPQTQPTTGPTDA